MHDRILRGLETVSIEQAEQVRDVPLLRMDDVDERADGAVTLDHRDVLRVSVAFVRQSCDERGSFLIGEGLRLDRGGRDEERGHQHHDERCRVHLWFSAPAGLQRLVQLRSGRGSLDTRGPVASFLRFIDLRTDSRHRQLAGAGSSPPSAAVREHRLSP